MNFNNQLIIIKQKMFEVHEHLGIENEFNPTNESLLFKAKTLKEAINWANEFCKREVVEYGVHVNDECWE